MIHTCKPLIFVLGVLVLFIFKSSDTIACTADACKHVHCDAPVSCPPHQTFACTECCCCLVCVPSIRKYYDTVLLTNKRSLSKRKEVNAITTFCHQRQPVHRGLNVLMGYASALWSINKTKLLKMYIL